MSVSWWLRLRRRWGGVKSHEWLDRRPSWSRTELTDDPDDNRQLILPDGGEKSIDKDSSILTARRFAILFIVLAIGQVFGVLLTLTQSQQLISTIDPIRFLYAVPLFNVIYYPVIFPDPPTTLLVLFGLAYFAVYAFVGVRVLRNDGVPARFTRPLQLFFAGNAVLYAVSPVLMTRAFTQAGFADFSTVEYYTDGLTIPLILVYGALMGVLYVAAGRFTDSADGTTPSEPADLGRRETETTSEKTAHRPPETRREEPTRGGPRRANASHDTQKPHSATGTQPSEPTPNAATEPASSPARSSPNQSPQAEQPPSPQAEQPPSADQPSTGHTVATDQEPAADTVGNSTPSEADSQRSEPGTDTTDSAADTGTIETALADDDTSNEISNLLSALNSGDRSQRLAAAERLGERIWDDPSAVDTDSLADALDAEQDAEIRMAIVNAVGALDSDAADQILREARFDPDPNVSDRAGELLE